MAAPQSLRLALNDNIYRIYDEVASDAPLIHQDIYSHTVNALHKGVDSVFGDLTPDDERFAMAQQFRRNASMFSAHKSLHQTQILANVKRKNASNVDKTYNTDYLRAEKNFTIRSARSADNWMDYEIDKDLYPYLEYTASVSVNKRDSHLQMVGMIRHIDDPIWDTWYPPNGWECKCGVVQRRDNNGAIEPTLKDIPKPPKTMRNNAAKSGQIFTNDHPMIAKNIKAHGQTSEMHKELLKWEACGYAGRKRADLTYFSNKGTGAIYSFDNKKEIMREYPYHKEAAEFIQDKGAFVQLIAQSEIVGVKSADAFINGRISDFKRVSSIESIDGQLRKANKQARFLKGMDAVLYCDSNLVFDEITKGIHQRVHRCKSLNKILLIHEDKLYKYNINTKEIAEAIP